MASEVEQRQNDPYVAFLDEHEKVTDEARYYQDRMNAVRAGYATWVRNEFSADGRVYNYFSNREPIGYVEVEGQTATVWMFPLNGSTDAEKVICFENGSAKDNLMYAVGLIEQIAYLESKELPNASH